jgi:hypothetical protein
VLASRALLTSVGVGDKDATATAAIATWVYSFLEFIYSFSRSSKMELAWWGE